MNADHPFTSVHHSDLILPTDAYRNALKRLDEGLGNREPFLLVTGESGTGKTTLVLETVAQWGERVAAAFLSNPALTRVELLEEIARRFGAEPPAGATKPQLLAVIERSFSDLAECNRIPVIVVEDAHELEADVLEELRLVTTAQAQARRRLEIVLVGLPRLDARLDEPDLAPLRQRVAVHCRMGALSHKETRQYLHHRVTAVGSDGARVFSRKTCNEIHDRTNGVPRAVNSLAAEAMRRAREMGTDAVSPDHVRTAATTLWGEAARSAPAAPSAAANTVDVPTPAAEAPRDTHETKAPSPPPRPAPAEPVAPTQPTPTAEATPQPAAGAAPARKPVNAPPQGAITESASVPAETPAARPAKSDAPRAAKRSHDSDPASAGAAVTAGSGSESKAKKAPARDETPDLAAAEAPHTTPDEPERPRAEAALEREWVARFIGDSGPPRIGALAQGVFEPESVTVSGRSRPVSNSAPVFLDETLDPVMVASVPESRPAPLPAAPPRRRGGMGALTSVAITSLAVGALAAIIILPHGTDLLNRHDSKTVAATNEGSDTAVEAGRSQSQVELTPSTPALQEIPSDRDTAFRKSDTEGGARRAHPESSPTTIPPETTVAADPLAASSLPPPAGGSEVADPASPAAAEGKRFTIEVATYYDRERAVAERDRLMEASGLKGWVVDASTYEGYRVVLGVFSTVKRAETAANRLLSRDVVLQGRVVSMPSRHRRH